MPRNVQDFKDHPLYVLERHLRRNQVIHPRNEVGKVAVGKSSASSTTKTTKTSPASKALEPLYRRRDVHVVRPANSWYRLGRDVKVDPSQFPAVHVETFDACAGRYIERVTDEEPNKLCRPGSNR